MIVPACRCPNLDGRVVATSLPVAGDLLGHVGGDGCGVHEVENDVAEGSAVRVSTHQSHLGARPVHPAACTGWSPAGHCRRSAGDLPARCNRSSWASGGALAAAAIALGMTRDQARQITLYHSEQNVLVGRSFRTLMTRRALYPEARIRGLAHVIVGDRTFADFALDPKPTEQPYQSASSLLIPVYLPNTAHYCYHETCRNRACPTCPALTHSSQPPAYHGLCPRPRGLRTLRRRLPVPRPPRHLSPRPAAAD